MLAGPKITPRRAAWFAFGAAALALGALGVVVPLLPTTPFVLLATFAFARSSDRWHSWLVSHPLFGPLIENWRAHGAISRPAKAAGVLAMAAVGVSVAIDAPVVVLAVQGVVLAGVAVFILSRPSPPARD